MAVSTIDCPHRRRCRCQSGCQTAGQGDECGEASAARVVPLIELATSTAEVAAAIADAPVRIALHEEADTSLAEELPVRGDAGASANEVALVIGPEVESASLSLNSCRLCRLFPAKMGSPILRSSTAGTVALGWVMGATGRWTVGD